MGNYLVSKGGRRSFNKLVKPSYSSGFPSAIKSMEGLNITSPKDNLTLDIISHSLNCNYWAAAFRNNQRYSQSWNIYYTITITEIRNTVLSIKNNEAPGPNGIPIEFLQSNVFGVWNWRKSIPLL